MKRILTALLMMPLMAGAEQWFEMPNQAGGKILLLTSDCGKDLSGKLVVSTMPSGENITGCWYFFAEMVHVVWEGGKTSSFEPRMFTPKERK